MSERIRGHIGNGTVYLRGWTNVDLFESGSALASDCRGGVEKWGTDEKDYYARVAHIDELFLGGGTPDHQTTVTDRYGRWSNLPFNDDEVDELWSVQCFEHLSKTEARYALMEARRVLKVGGLLTLDVPDHEQSLAEYARLCWEANSETDVPKKIETKRRAAFMLRHLLGSRKSDFGFHMGSWSKDRLIDFCADYGFKPVRENENFHFYPAFSVTFSKQPTCSFPELDEPLKPYKAAYEYAGPGGTPLTVPPEWKVLEVGPGRNRWPVARSYVDIDNANLVRIKDEFSAMPGIPWPDFYHCSVTEMSTCFPTPVPKHDYVFLSHVLEHVQDPLLAATELNAIADAGCSISPSPFKEGMFLAHEQDHKWWVIAGKDRLFFHRIPEGMYAAVFQDDLSGEAHRIWRYGERRLEGLCNKYKRHFLKVEPLVDCIFHWNGTLRIEVLE